ncbi:hypothetical protein PS6_009902 [Mucor atramentarius]
MDRMELQHESSKLDEMEYMLVESQKKADDELSLIKSELGVRESTLTKILELENKADAVESQCKQQEMKLESFTSLPSYKIGLLFTQDMVLASIKIQEAEDDLFQ